MLGLSNFPIRFLSTVCERALKAKLKVHTVRFLLIPTTFFIEITQNGCATFLSGASQPHAKNERYNSFSAIKNVVVIRKQTHSVNESLTRVRWGEHRVTGSLL